MGRTYRHAASSCPPLLKVNRVLPPSGLCSPAVTDELCSFVSCSELSTRLTATATRHRTGRTLSHHYPQCSGMKRNCPKYVELMRHIPTHVTRAETCTGPLSEIQYEIGFQKYCFVIFDVSLLSKYLNSLSVTIVF